MAEQFKISTLTKQSSNQLAQGDGGQVILAPEGDYWWVNKVVTTEGGDNRTITASRLGMLQVMANLIPTFKDGSDELTGGVELSPGDSCLWRFEERNGGYIITAREESIPAGVTFPAGGRVFLVWEGTEVKWMWRGGIAPDVPPQGIWLLEKKEETTETDAEEKFKITCFTRAKLPPQRFLAEDEKTSGIILALEGDLWYLRTAKTSDDGSVIAKAILAPAASPTQVITQLQPVFPAQSRCLDYVYEKNGSLKLSAISRSDGAGFPWVFEERNGGLIITVLGSSVPSYLKYPAGSKVYLVWDSSLTVTWQQSGGVQEEIPDNAIWRVGKEGKKEGGVVEHPPPPHPPAECK